MAALADDRPGRAGARDAAGPGGHEEGADLKAGTAFEAVARAQPHALAVAADDAVWTYQDLHDTSVRLAAWLEQEGIGPGDVVALGLGRTAHHIAAILACWRLGAAFLPLDPGAPEERVRACLMETRSRVRLTLDGEGLRIERLPSEGAPLGKPEDELAYVIYTSGSTGRPKGVRVSHRGLVPMLRAQIEAFGLGPGKRALLYLSTAFDASISDLGTALLSGAALITPSAPPGPRELAAFLRANAITHADLPPALLPLIDPLSLPETMETVIIGGEVCSPPVVRAWARHLRLVNVYGPTEATICTSLCVCDPERWDRPLLGTPLPHVEYRVDGEELLIGGEALALGYVDRPELEERRFQHLEGKRYYRTGDRVRPGPDGMLEFVGRIDRQLKVRGQLVAPEEIEARLLALKEVREAAVVAESAARSDGSTRTVLTAFVVLREGATASADEVRKRLGESLPGWMLPRIVLLESLVRGSTGKVDFSALRGSGGAEWNVCPEVLNHRLRETPYPAFPLQGKAPSTASADRLTSEKQASEVRSDEPGRSTAERLSLQGKGGIGGLAKAMVQNLRQDVPLRTRLLAEAFEEVLGVSGVAENADFYALGGDSLAAIEVAAVAQLSGLSVEASTVLAARTPAAIAAAEHQRGRTVRELDTLAARLASELGPAQNNSQPAHDWLLTGATGYLGTRLLPELLARTDARIHCLVRAANDVEARKRVRCDDPRIVAHAADLSAPHLGLSPERWQELAERVGHVVHAAAAVNLALPFEVLAASNVRGAFEIARLVRTGSRKRLQFVSSLAVLVATDLEAPVIDERTMLPPEARIFGGYAQSKWVAEQLLRSAVPEVRIIRPGLLTGDSVTGIGAPTCQLSSFLRGVAALGCVPEGDHERLRVDITPIDHAAPAIAGLVATNGRELVHVSSARGASLADLLRALRQSVAIEVVDRQEFLRRARQSLPRDTAMALVASSHRLLGDGGHRDADLFLLTDRRFETERDSRIPAADEALLSRYVRVAVGGSP